MLVKWHLKTEGFDAFFDAFPSWTVTAYNVTYLITHPPKLVGEFLKFTSPISFISMAANPTEMMSSHPHLQAFLVHGEITNSFSLSYSSLSGHHNGQGTKADTACEGKEPTS